MKKTKSKKKSRVAVRKRPSKPIKPSRADFKAARKFGKKHKKAYIVKHGVRRPWPGSGVVERIWLLIEKITREKGKAGIATRAEVLTAAAKDKEMKPGTVSLNYCLWRKFMGLKGKRIASPHPRKGKGKSKRALAKAARAAKPAKRKPVAKKKPKAKAPAKKKAVKRNAPKKAHKPAPKKPTPPKAAAKAPAAPKPPKAPAVAAAPKAPTPPKPPVAPVVTMPAPAAPVPPTFTAPPSNTPTVAAL